MFCICTVMGGLFFPVPNAPLVYTDDFDLALNSADAYRDHHPEIVVNSGMTGMGVKLIFG
jgi:hypothetical protein